MKSSRALAIAATRAERQQGAPACGFADCEMLVTMGRGGWQLPTSSYCRVHNAMDRRARTYGTDLVNVWQEYLRQEGRCAVCRTELTFIGTHDKCMHMDHDHTTGRFRGILCRKCNSVLGYMKDDPVRLRAAAEYLERNA